MGQRCHGSGFGQGDCCKPVQVPPGRHLLQLLDLDWRLIFEGPTGLALADFWGPRRRRAEGAGELYRVCGLWPSAILGQLSAELSEPYAKLLHLHSMLPTENRVFF
jgi:hypothetical protein